MRKSSFITAVLGTAALTLPFGIYAQDEDRASLSDVWLVMPKAGMTTQFENAVRTHLAYRADVGDSRSWTAYAATVGSNPRLYQWRAGGLTWADQDAYMAEDQEKGYSAHWFANVDQYVDHYHHFMERSDFENSHWPEGLGQHPYYGVTTWSWKQGAGPASEEARKKLSQIAMEDGWADRGYNWMWLSRIGGRPTLMIVAEYDSYADMAPPEQDFFEFVSETVGAEEAGKLFADFGSGFTDSSYTVWAHRPDLSTTDTAGSD